MKVNFNNKTVGGFNYELTRGVSLQSVGAAEFGECMETMARVTANDFDSWIREWAKTAEAVEAFAGRQAAAGDRRSAGMAYLRASNYFRMACFYASHTDPRHRRLWQESVEAFHRMIDLRNETVEKLDIPFAGKKLPAYYIPCGQENRPVLIAIGGFDSTKEEVYCWVGEAARHYGWNCLIFEGPGQWGALMGNPGLTFCPDYEKPVGAAVDYLMTRSDIDREKIAIIGYSMGGYLSVRGALDPRVKACIANTLVVDCGASARAGMKGMVKHEALTNRLFTLLMKINTAARWGFMHSSWTLGVRTPMEWVAAYEEFTLLGYERLLKGKPMLFFFGEDDIMDAAAPSKEIVVTMLDYIKSLDCPRYVRLFTQTEGASSHCQMGGLSYAQSAVFAWLEHALCGAPIPPRESDPAFFTSLFQKYGGESGGAKAKALLGEITFI